jgi:hypothetical protein
VRALEALNRAHGRRAGRGVVEDQDRLRGDADGVRQGEGPRLGGEAVQRIADRDRAERGVCAAAEVGEVHAAGARRRDPARRPAQPPLGDVDSGVGVAALRRDPGQAAGAEVQRGKLGGRFRRGQRRAVLRLEPALDDEEQRRCAVERAADALCLPARGRVEVGHRRRAAG